MLYRPVLLALATLITSALGSANTARLRDLSSVYETNDPAFFRQHRVREIQVHKQFFNGPNSPEPPQLEYTLQFNQQGQQVRYEQEQQRVEAAYNDAGALTDLSRWVPAAGTAGWQPTTREHFPEPAGTPGYLDEWDAYHRNWIRLEDRTRRRWQAHDTTYVLNSYRPGPLAKLVRPEAATRSVLTRSYQGPAGTTRTDVLTMSDQELQETDYYYTRRQGLAEESGDLFYDSLLRAHGTHHRLPTTHPALDYLQDSLARRAQGQRVVEFRSTYDASGRLRTRNGLSYERDAQGRLTATMHRNTRNGKFDGTLYEYLPNGLVAKQKSVSDLGFASVIYSYTYRYY